MDPEVIEALLSMGEFYGALSDFLSESAARIQNVSNCSPEEAYRTLQDVRDGGEIDFEMEPGDGLPLPATGVPPALFYWYVRSAA